MLIEEEYRELCGDREGGNLENAAESDVFGEVREVMSLSLFSNTDFRAGNCFDSFFLLLV